MWFSFPFPQYKILWVEKVTMVLKPIRGWGYLSSRDSWVHIFSVPSQQGTSEGGGRTFHLFTQLLLSILPEGKSLIYALSCKNVSDPRKIFCSWPNYDNENEVGCCCGKKVKNPKAWHTAGGTFLDQIVSFTTCNFRPRITPIYLVHQGGWVSCNTHPAQQQ